MKENNVGANIRKIRIAKRLSLRKLATLADVSSSAINEIELGKSKASVVTLDKLSVALKCNQSDFFDDNYKVIINTKEEVHSFTIKLIQDLLKEGVISDTENASQNVIDAILINLKLDASRQKEMEKNK